jgi:hypothetical protein
MSTKTTRSGRSVKRPAKLISEDDGNEEPMSTLTTKKPIKPLTKVNNMKEIRQLHCTILVDLSGLFYGIMS